MVKRARVFMTGGSQAIRLPAEFRFAGDVVYVRRNADGDVVLSDQPREPYAAFIAARAEIGTVPEGFLSQAERAQGREVRDPFAGMDDEPAGEGA
ncbi:AbrB/MazE/SpoVT family DNA-binding domain-containing protein [Ideonella azotifigens]|uniref:SpoVT-AbrB domain-containing protein n=1 Tax=Ideonella azotifigens TaxID=513160 RepID=A0ABN1K2Z9_9BURK|nr:AbrB/MazE/SpoVT family DNA-binding domain-containing protein [Ideonella azotifigens]MCD2344618.1 AbrB/MazE/SpoVT family DNA-binding domain-containing protein [Ideonella azotifigens]